MRTLIVEDDPISRRLLEKMLSPLGDCRVVSNGREAVAHFSQALLAREPYDLVCLDIMMPEMDGHECLQTLRRIEQEQRVPRHGEATIVMTTALDSTQTINEAYRRGCTAYLVKPIRKDYLFSALREYKLMQ